MLSDGFCSSFASSVFSGFELSGVVGTFGTTGATGVDGPLGTDGATAPPPPEVFPELLLPLLEELPPLLLPLLLLSTFCFSVISTVAFPVNVL